MMPKNCVLKEMCFEILRDAFYGQYTIKRSGVSMEDP